MDSQGNIHTMKTSMTTPLLFRAGPADREVAETATVEAAAVGRTVTSVAVASAAAAIPGSAEMAWLEMAWVEMVDKSVSSKGSEMAGMVGSETSAEVEMA